MLTVTLKPDVAEQVRQLAKGAQTEADDIVDEALRTYLAQARREKLEAEARAFEQQRATLLALYPGEYVAIHLGKVIDHDREVRALHLRVFAKLAHTPVLLKLVTENSERELVGCRIKPARNSLPTGRIGGSVGYPPLEERNHARPQTETGQAETQRCH